MTHHTLTLDAQAAVSQSESLLGEVQRLRAIVSLLGRRADHVIQSAVDKIQSGEELLRVGGSRAEAARAGEQVVTFELSQSLLDSLAAIGALNADLLRVLIDSHGESSPGSVEESISAAVQAQRLSSRSSETGAKCSA